MKIPQNKKALVITGRNYLIEAKRLLEKAAAEMNTLADAEFKDGHLAGCNGAMEMAGCIESALGELKKGHAAGSRCLCDCYEDGSDIAIQPYGGGTR